FRRQLGRRLLLGRFGRLRARPLDLSTPEPEPGALKPTTPLAGKPSTPEWISKAGIDYSKPAIPAVAFQPDQLLAGAVPRQSTGVGWATITAPGLEGAARLGQGRDRHAGRSLARARQARHHVEPFHAGRRRCLVDVAERRFNDAPAAERDGAGPQLGHQPGA